MIDYRTTFFIDLGLPTIETKTDWRYDIVLLNAKRELRAKAWMNGDELQSFQAVDLGDGIFGLTAEPKAFR